MKDCVFCIKLPSSLIVSVKLEGIAPSDGVSLLKQFYSFYYNALSTSDDYGIFDTDLVENHGPKARVANNITLVIEALMSVNIESGAFVRARATLSGYANHLRQHGPSFQVFHYSSKEYREHLMKGLYTDSQWICLVDLTRGEMRYTFLVGTTTEEDLGMSFTDMFYKHPKDAMELRIDFFNCDSLCDHFKVPRSESLELTSLMGVHAEISRDQWMGESCTRFFIPNLSYASFYKFAKGLRSKYLERTSA